MCGECLKSLFSVYMDYTRWFIRVDYLEFLKESYSSAMGACIILGDFLPFYFRGVGQ